MNTYVTDDYLSVENLLISMQQHPPLLQLPGSLNNETEGTAEHIEQTTPNTSDELIFDILETAASPLPSAPQSSHFSHDLQATNHSSTSPHVIRTHSTQQHHSSYEQISSDDDNEPKQQQQSSTLLASTIALTEELTAKEIRRHRNRACTLRQRTSNYQHEIIRRGIDARFTVGQVKDTLRRAAIPFSAINISTSPLTGRTSLYIGIRNRSKLREYETRTRHWFSTDHYNELHARFRRHRSHVSDSRNANRH